MYKYIYLNLCYCIRENIYKEDKDRIPIYLRVTGQQVYARVRTTRPEFWWGRARNASRPGMELRCGAVPVTSHDVTWLGKKAWNVLQPILTASGRAGDRRWRVCVGARARLRGVWCEQSESYIKEHWRWWWTVPLSYSDVTSPCLVGAIAHI